MTWVILLVSLWCSLAAATLNNCTFLVGTYNVAPFSQETDDGFVGFSVDYFDLVFSLMQTLNENTTEFNVCNKYRFVRENSTRSSDDLVDVVANEQVDFGIAAITITRSRARTVLFSQPYFNSGLKLGIRNVNSGGVDDVNIWGFLDPFGPGVWISIFIGTVCAGILLWLMDRSAEGSPFAGEFLEGGKEGIWVAFKTLFHASAIFPKLWSGKIWIIAYSFLGLIFMSSYTANLTTILTVNSKKALITDVSDLRGFEVGTVAGTTSEDYILNTLPASKAKLYDTFEEMMSALENRDVPVILYDSPVLIYYYRVAGQAWGFGLRGGLLQEEEVGIAMPLGSQYQQPLDVAIIKANDDPRLDEIYQKWFGTSVDAILVQRTVTAEDTQFDFWDFGGIWLALIVISFLSLISRAIGACFGGDSRDHQLLDMGGQNTDKNLLNAN